MRAWIQDYLNYDLLYRETKVCLSGCGIVRLPREILQLRNLQELDVRENEISILHEWIDGCTQLSIFNISYNQLKELPKGLFRCRSLQDLDISHNNIKRLPREIADLKKLKIFLANNNRLSAIPDGLRSLDLRKINLLDNPMLEPLKSVEKEDE